MQRTPISEITLNQMFVSLIIVVVSTSHNDNDGSCRQLTRQSRAARHGRSPAGPAARLVALLSAGEHVRVEPRPSTTICRDERALSVGGTTIVNLD
jgi:hypothetical protein